MGNKLDRKTLENLLETMEPSEIRASHGSQLAENPQWEALLKAFENLDENLQNLKAADPPPAIKKPIFRGRPALLHTALPLAAMVLLGFLFWTQNDTIQPAKVGAVSQTEHAPLQQTEMTQNRPPEPADLKFEERERPVEQVPVSNRPEPMLDPPLPAPSDRTPERGGQRQKAVEEAPASYEAESSHEPLREKSKRELEDPNSDFDPEVQEAATPSRKRQTGPPQPVAPKPRPQTETKDTVASNKPSFKQAPSPMEDNLDTSNYRSERSLPRPNRSPSAQKEKDTSGEAMVSGFADTAEGELQEVVETREAFTIPTNRREDPQAAATGWLALFNQWQEGQPSPPGLFAETAIVQWPSALGSQTSSFDLEAKPSVRLWYQGHDGNNGLLLGWESTQGDNPQRGTLLVKLNGLGECNRLSRP